MGEGCRLEDIYIYIYILIIITNSLGTGFQAEPLKDSGNEGLL